MMTRFHSRPLLFALIGSLLSALPAHAAPKIQKRTPETYPATEVEAAPLPSQKIRKTSSALPINTPSFETVTPSQIDSIAGRLKIVEEILRISGRAYDYRTLTTSQLEEILSSLRPQPSEPSADGDAS